MTTLRICLASAEVAPFAKTGGLADVAAGLSRFLGAAGHDVRVFMPLYQSVRQSVSDLRPVPGQADLEVRMGRNAQRLSIVTAQLPDSDVPVYFIDCPQMFDRGALYTQDADEHARFALFSSAVIESCQRMQWAPDVFHCNDWHTGLLPLLLKTQYAWDRLFARSKTLLTIHNIGYQGVFGAHVLEDLGMGELRRLLPQDDLNDNRVNFLKTGLITADALSTVSETYAREIQTPELGVGLDSVLRSRRDALYGIVNGIDYGDWNPLTDPLIPHPFGPDDLDGKAENKRELREAFDLVADSSPLIGVVSRLTGQKGFELLPDMLPLLLHREAITLLVLGSGEDRYEEYFQWLRDTFPDRVAFYRGYNNELAHRIEAGADMFLMPSRYEPCGLNQMYSLKYGTVPIVRRTGGLADTVEPFDAATGRGTGFVFDEFSTQALLDVVENALGVWRDREAWRTLVRNGMACDFSWERQGLRYVQLYGALASKAPA